MMCQSAMMNATGRGLASQQHLITGAYRSLRRTSRSLTGKRNPSPLWKKLSNAHTHTHTHTHAHLLASVATLPKARDAGKPSEGLLLVGTPANVSFQSFQVCF